MPSKSESNDRIGGNGGFTLIEIILVTALLALIASLVVPRFSYLVGGGKGDMLTLRSMIAKTFDHAFLRNENCLLAIHCAQPDSKARETDPDGIMSRENGISIVTVSNDGKLEDIKNRFLQKKRFPSGFRIEEVILSNGDKITSGTSLVPFSADGLSSDTIIHVLSGEDRYSIIIYRFRKEPRVVEDFVDYEKVRSGNVL